MLNVRGDVLAQEKYNIYNVSWIIMKSGILKMITETNKKLIVENINWEIQIVIKSNHTLGYQIFPRDSIIHQRDNGME
jgi:hypothetical protein